MYRLVFLSMQKLVVYLFKTQYDNDDLIDLTRQAPNTAFIKTVQNKSVKVSMRFTILSGTAKYHLSYACQL